MSNYSYITSTTSDTSISTISYTKTTTTITTLQYLYVIANHEGTVQPIDSGRDGVIGEVCDQIIL